MKLLFDQNLSFRLVGQLTAEFPHSQHVRMVGLAAASDSTIWAYAAKNNFVIVSKDVDFQHRAMLLGHPPKVVWIRIGNCSTNSITNLLQLHTEFCSEFNADPAASFLALA